MRISIYETLIFCEIKTVLVTDAAFDFSLRIGCKTNKEECSLFHDKVLRLLCTKIELGNYKHDGFSKCYLSEYVKSNIIKFTRIINYLFNSKIEDDAYLNYSNELFKDLYLETFKNIVLNKYSEEQYEYIYAILKNESIPTNNVTDANAVEKTDEKPENEQYSIDKNKDEVVLENFYNKYRLKLINGKRYYEYNMATVTPVLDDTVPYVFRYQDIEIYESTWKKMTIRILEEIDKRNPKTEEKLLSVSYWWSKSPVFAKEAKTNFVPFKTVFLNANHSSTHAMMNIQGLLYFYGINPAACYFVIRRHHVAEPDEIKEHFRNKTIEGFKNCLKFRGYSDEKIETTINNYNKINSILANNSGFKDFFLFDDYNYFTSYKNKVIEQSKNVFYGDSKKLIIVTNCLNRLDEYYKNREFYDYIKNLSIPLELKDELESNIDYLFTSLNTNVITASKLYARMRISKPNLLESLGTFNNQDDLYRIASSFFRKTFCFRMPFISKSKEMNLENDDIIISYAYSLNEVTVDALNNYSDKMHLNRINNYAELFRDMSGEYVQVERDKLVNKERFGLKDEKLESISNEIKYYIKSFGSIDSETFNGYSSLTQIGKPWNKYLLLGIVRTYLSHEFKIAYSGGTYKSFSYSISLL